MLVGWLVNSRGGHALSRWSFLDAAAACASHPRRCCFGMGARTLPQQERLVRRDGRIHGGSSRRPRSTAPLLCTKHPILLIIFSFLLCRPLPRRGPRCAAHGRPPPHERVEPPGQQALRGRRFCWWMGSFGGLDWACGLVLGVGWLLKQERHTSLITHGPFY